MTDTSLSTADSLMLQTFNKMMDDPKERKQFIADWLAFEKEHWDDPVYPDVYLPQLEHRYKNEAYVLDKVQAFVENRERSLIVTKEELPFKDNVTSNDIDGYVDRAFKVLRDRGIVVWESKEHFPSYRIA